MSTDKTDAFGTRMKEYEFQETKRTFLPMLPVYARIDGRGFSNFTRGMERPFDTDMMVAMIQTTKHLVEHTHAKIGYTQSDEISLAWHAPEYESSIFFNGKIMKMASVLAGLATAAFTKAVLTSNNPNFRAYADRLPHFDARVLAMPSREEVANMFLWRNQDATKNAISMAAQHYFTHSSLQGVNSAQMQERLWQESNINFNSYPESFKRGTFVRRVAVERPFTAEELARIPENLRPSADTLITRNNVISVPMPIFSKVTNRVGVIFDGEAPVVIEEHIDLDAIRMASSLSMYCTRAN
jgi:tRNA(His) guanylyltransferase